jgi:ATP adenylyltransferase
MQVLWAPWRMAYIGGPKTSGCIFCTAKQAPDGRADLVLAQHPAIVMLNKYPYASGHVMVAPQRHVASLTDLPTDEYQTLMAVVQRATAIIREAFQPEGLNLGMNIGAAAGAGIADHVHWHIVPRWVGDTNFMPLLADVRVMPEHLEATYDRLRPLFAALERA